MKNVNDLKTQLMQDADFKKAYDNLDPEYKLARDIIKARKAKHMTQAQLAERAGVRREIIARLESGTSNPKYSTITKVVSVLGKELKLVGIR